jgi:hypothetical protein
MSAHDRVPRDADSPRPAGDRAGSSIGSRMSESGRLEAIRSAIAAAGLPAPEAVRLGHDGNSVAVGFRIEGVLETFEGCGETDAALVADISRQLRHRLACGPDSEITV